MSAAAAVGASPAASPLDAALEKQPYALEPLLPTPTNCNPVHLPRGDLLHFITLQQWVADKLRMRLPLLNGMFVLVPSDLLQPMARVLQAACGHSPSDSSSTATAAVAAAIPWRLRQVSAVEAAPGVDAADATLVLVGGDRVRAGTVHEGQLANVQDHEYLCCEVADMQQRRQLRQLRVFDVAHMAWRLRVACDLEAAVAAYQQEQATLAPGMPHASGSTTQATSLQSLRSVLMQLPPDDWIRGQVLQYVELNPLVGPEPPDQPWQLLSAEQHAQLLQGAAAAWQYYVQRKLAGQQPQPVTDLVPWLPVHSEAEECAAASVQQEPGVVGLSAPAHGAASTAQQGVSHTQHKGQAQGSYDHHAALPFLSSSDAGSQHSPVVSQQLVHGTSSEQPPSSTSPAHSSRPHSSSGRGLSEARCGLNHRSRSRSRGRSRVRARYRSYSRSRSRSYSSSSRGTSPCSSNSLNSGLRASARSHSWSWSRSRSRSHGRRGVRSASRSRSPPSSSTSRGRSTKRRLRTTSDNSPDCAPCSPPGRVCGGSDGRRSARRNQRCRVGVRLPVSQGSRRLPCLEHFFHPTDPWSQYIEVKVQQYLQQLAVKVANVSGPPCEHRPHVVELGWLRYQHLLPLLLQKHYGSVSNFVRARPELQWVAGPFSRKFVLVQHAQLLAAAEQQQQQQQHQRQQVAVQGGSQSDSQQDPDSTNLGGCSCSSGWPEYLQPQQQSLEAAAAASTAAAAIEAAAAARRDVSSTQAPEMPTQELGPSLNVDQSTQAAIMASWERALAAKWPIPEVYLWMLKLATLLPPGPPTPCISLGRLHNRLPVPKHVVDLYGGIKKFVSNTPGLFWDGEPMESPIRLDPMLHQELRLMAAAVSPARAAAAAAAASSARAAAAAAAVSPARAAAAAAATAAAVASAEAAGRSLRLRRWDAGT